MVSNKRKHNHEESEDEDATCRKKNINDSPIKSNNRRNKRNRIYSDDESDSNDMSKDNDDSSISINDIKKQASKRAKNLSKAMENDDEVQSKVTKTKKSPAPVQKNTMLNYFKKTTSSSSLNKSTEDIKKTQEKASVSDDFITTTIIKDDVIIKKQDKDDSLDSKHKTPEAKHKSPIKKIKEESDHVEMKKSPLKGKLEDKKSKNDKVDKKLKEDNKIEKKSIEAAENSGVDKKSKVDTKVEKKIKEETKHKENRKRESSRTPTKDLKKTENKNLKKEIASPIKNKKKHCSSETEDELMKTTVSDSSKKTKITPKKAEAVKETKKSTPKKKNVPESLPTIVEPKRISELWVDKYKPTTVKNVIGMSGDRSPLNKLLNWLKDWHLNAHQKPVFSKFGGGNNDGVGLKAALLSGPPGIGKTTSAQIACKELGFDYLEMNASDKRSKKTINEDVKELLGNTKLTSFYGQKSSTDDNKVTAKHCLIMDEVDGMAGNEDRGGVAELIQLIKTSKIPIICICNDRSHPKMRSLVNYCFDLRFHKPKIENIRGPLKSICFKEKVNIPTNVIDDLIVSTNFDIRQCIGNLAMLAAGQENVKNMVNHNEKPIKDVKLGPFEAVRKVFSTGPEYASMSFADKSDLFFTDYTIMPLFVYENYCQINVGTKESSVAKQLKRMSRSIDAISMGDIIEKEIRTNQNWSLLPLQAAFSTVMPGSHMRSQNGLGFPQFPQYMGKISTTNKNIRLADELVSHMTLSISGTRTSFSLDYLESMKNTLSKPLLTKGSNAVPEILEVMENYSMTRENMNSLFELSLWNGEDDPLKNVDSKVKRALTTAYNKKDFVLPYSGDSDIKKLEKRGKGSKSKGNNFDSEKYKNSDEENEDEEEEFMEDFY